MEVIPAIDIREGRCVRLLRGDFARETRYDFDPVELAARYRDAGARWLHVVDLDGAKAGRPQNLPLVERMRDASGLKIQLGGGLRTRADLVRALSIAERAVVGSLAVTQPETVGAWLDELGGERLTLALDVRLGADGTPTIATHGWTQASAVTLADAVERYLAHALRHVLCTDIDRDGALSGPNVALYADCVRRWPQVAFVASGGVRDARDLAALADVGVAGAVSGKALLEGTLTPEEMKPFLPAA
jgi:phosphoribosylformimino-5-aminoimidazole carboxamide ribotide isomerase